MGRSTPAGRSIWSAGSRGTGVAGRYTASRLSIELALAIAMSDRAAARREEARMKRLQRPAKLALLACPNL